MSMNKLEYPKLQPESHSVITIKLGELYRWGFYDPNDESWRWDALDDEQYVRVCTKFLARYYDREITIIPPGEWKRSYIRKLNEIMPKYKLLYKAAEDMDVLQESREYHKSREIFSEYPQTQLAGREDYASAGRDNENETLREGNPIDMIVDAADRYRDIDVMILDDLEILFTTLASVSLNIW